jgi:hypothetical protein
MHSTVLFNLKIWPSNYKEVCILIYHSHLFSVVYGQKSGDFLEHMNSSLETCLSVLHKF